MRYQTFIAYPDRSAQAADASRRWFCFPLLTLSRNLTLLLLALLWLLAARPGLAVGETDGLAELPAELGAVVYRMRADAPVQLYIVANGHRSALTGASGVETLQAQVETFRIGEWLIRRRQLGLLLPEGYFGCQPQVVPGSAPAARLDSAALAERLADPVKFVNAELLLHERYGVALRQVEDREVYREALALLHAGRDAAWLDPDFDALLAYRQKCRSAAIMQGVPSALADPSAVAAELSDALMTIGLGHLADIIEFLDAGEIQISAPARATGLTAVQARLALASQPVGVTIIIPRSLLNNPLLAHLDRG